LFDTWGDGQDTPVHNHRRGDRVLGLGFWAGLLALLGGLVWLTVMLVTQGAERAVPWATVFSTVLAIAGALGHAGDMAIGATLGGVAAYGGGAGNEAAEEPPWGGSRLIVLSLFVAAVLVTAVLVWALAPVPIKIDRVNAPVPRCATFGGEGDVPPDQTLWLAVLTPDTRKYFFRPVMVNAVQHKWISRKVTIGSQDDPPGTPFMIYAVLVDNVTNQLLQQGRFAGGIAALPDTFVKVHQIEVERGSDSAECK
jgi:hypothetical protein